jgi:hypothetical protein
VLSKIQVPVTGAVDRGGGISVTTALATTMMLIGVGIMGVVGGRRLRHHWTRRLAVAVSGLVALAGAVGAVWAHALGAGDRSFVAFEVAPGVLYQRVAVDQPRRQVFHLVEIDLDNDCPSLLTTTPGPDGVVGAETATEFVDRTGVVLSVNVAFFYPVHEYPYWSAYPHSGDPITALGKVVIDGVSYGTDSEWGKALSIAGGAASIGGYVDDVDLSIPGALILASDGEIVAPESEALARTVVGVDVDANRLILLVADGKQPGYAEGTTLAEAALWLVARGADDVLELDGGGSSTMAAMVDGRTELLSRPIHQRIPGRQRPVATHLGVVDTCAAT